MLIPIDSSLPFPEESGFPHDLEEIGRHFGRLLRIAMFEQETEFVSSSRASVSRVRRAELSSATTWRSTASPACMPAGVVHLLEPVQVQVAECVMRESGARTLERPFQPALELGPVDQAGKIVVGRIVDQLLGDDSLSPIPVRFGAPLGDPSVVDVADEALDAFELPVPVGAHAVLFDPAPVSGLMPEPVPHTKGMAPGDGPLDVGVIRGAVLEMAQAGERTPALEKRVPGISGQGLDRVVYIKDRSECVVQAAVHHTGKVLDEKPEALLVMAQDVTSQSRFQPLIAAIDEVRTSPLPRSRRVSGEGGSPIRCPSWRRAATIVRVMPASACRP